MNSGQKSELVRRCPGTRWHVDTGKLAAFRTGGVIEALVEIEDSTFLPGLIGWLKREGIPWHALGALSNVLFCSGLHAGVFIRLRAGTNGVVLLPEDEADRAAGRRRFSVPAGLRMARLLGWCLSHSLAGFEFMTGVPGMVGGALAGNAGAFGASIGDRLLALSAVNALGETVDFAAEELDFQYRKTNFPPQCALPLLVTRAIFTACPETRGLIFQRMRDILAQRRAKQPLGQASAGSFFKNPPGDYAGRLIERAGLKGYCVGDAMVSKEHANIFVNRGGASPEEILALMRAVQQCVYEQSGVMLEPEVRIFVQ